MANVVTYRGGPLLTNVSPMALWARVNWPDGTTLDNSLAYKNGQFCSIDQFFVDILSSSWMGELSQAFSPPGYTIGVGAFLGTSDLLIEPAQRTVFLWDSDIRAALQNAIANGLLPDPPSDACYFVIAPMGVNVGFDARTDPGLSAYHSASVHGGQPNAWHSAFYDVSGKRVYYCVIGQRYPDDVDTLTRMISHQLAEAITDPGLSLPGLLPGWIGPPCDASLLPCEVMDYCPRNSVQVSGYQVSQWVLEIESGPDTIAGHPAQHAICGPEGDQLPRTNPLTCVIRFNRFVVRTSCAFGSIVEGQYVPFYAVVEHRGQPANIKYIDWDAYDQDGRHLNPTSDRNQLVYWAFVPPGTKSIVVGVSVTTDNLGCSATQFRRIEVVTQDEAIAEETVCERMARLAELAHIYEIHPPPVFPPIWDPRRDFRIDPLTPDELDQLVPFARALGELVREAEPLLAEIVREARPFVRGDNGEDRESGPC